VTKKRADLKAVLKIVERGPGRSTLFYWMLDNHDDLLRVWPGRSIRWAALCAKFDALGLTDTNGKPAKEDTARITWWRVRKEAQEAKDHQKFGIKPTRDRARRAPVAQPGRATGVGAPSRPATPTAQVSSPGSVGQAMAAGPDDPTLDPTRPGLEGKIPREVVEARKAAMRKTLAERSGR